MNRDQEMEMRTRHAALCQQLFDEATDRHEFVVDSLRDMHMFGVCFMAMVISLAAAMRKPEHVATFYADATEKLQEALTAVVHNPLMVEKFMKEYNVDNQPMLDVLRELRLVVPPPS